jgi:hypothetical protein
LPRSLSADGKALVSVNLAEIRYTPRSPSKAPIESDIDMMRAEIARLEAAVSGHRADFERERDRADRLMVELLRATTQAMTAREAMARLEGELQASRADDRGCGPVEADGPAVSSQASQVRRLAAVLVNADRRACR